MKFRSNYDGKRYRSCVDFTDTETLTEQHHKDGCDITKIVNQYDKTGLITHVNNATAEYGDFTEVNEYQESLTKVIKAQQAFDELPAHIRKKFANDPGEFFEFATDPKNQDEMYDLGLAIKEDVVENIQKVEIVDKETPDEKTA